MEKSRKSPVEINTSEFQQISKELTARLCSFSEAIPLGPVTNGDSPGQMKSLLKVSTLPDTGKPAAEVVSEAAELLLANSLLNGHPRFMGYITSSAAPIAAFAEMICTVVNPNVGANILSPMATEIEKQTIQWIAELIGYPADTGGIMVSGGNMANFTAFLTARAVKASASLRDDGLRTIPKLLVYCSTASHGWVEKAAILFGHGRNAVRWVETDEGNQMNLAILESMILADLANGDLPFMVVGNAGDVSTGVIDDLKSIAGICSLHNLWFHVDGAYGAPAATLPELSGQFTGLELADSIALDPHKWLYSALEAGCTLVKKPEHMLLAFSSHPDYFNFREGQETPHNYYEYGLQNSRDFKALKVWLAFKQVGRKGYEEMIREDIRLSRLLFELARQHEELEAVSQNLSITTFRYVPKRLDGRPGDDEMLNSLNEDLVNKIQKDGRLFVSHALVSGKYLLRACIVNFRTSTEDIHKTIDLVVEMGRQISAL